VANNVEANLLACHTPSIAGEVFNIACGERFTLLQLVEQINLILGKNIQPTFEESRIGDVKHSQADIKKIKKMMNFNVVADFATGLEKTVESLINEGY
jgi:nucleoside-diphosphate-sugar epimerase